MPNFIAKNLKGINLPFKSENVEFCEIYKGRNLDLVKTKSFESDFFIALKKSGENFVIKGEKLTRPAKVGHLQKALEIFRDKFCENVVNEAFAFKSNSLIDKISPIVNELQILEILKEKKFNEIFVEIGFGSGRHLLFQAQNNPQILIIGIEIYKPALEQVAKLAMKADLQNILLVNSDARVLLSLMQNSEISKVFLHFPVPWDDAPHRRVISAEFAKILSRILKRGGSFELRTDSLEYADFAREIFGNFKNFSGEFFKNRNLEISSKYEDRWKKQEKDIFDLNFTNNEPLGEKNENFSFNFGNFSAEKIYENFTPLTFKGDDFFVHFEEIYKSEKNEILIKISFGAFNFAQQCFIEISNQKEVNYFLKIPLKTEQNFKSHQKIMEIFSQWTK